MAGFFWGCISIAVKLFIQSICQKVIEFASDAAQWILEPSSRALPAVTRLTTKVVPPLPLPPPPPPPPPPHYDHVSSDAKLENIISSTAASISSTTTTTTPERSGSWDIIIKTESYDHVDRNWETIEDKILQDIEPLASTAKSILQSGKYRNGDRLTEKDEKYVIENLLQYHSSFRKKIGSRFDYIMVDRHVEFEDSRCMYVVRTDGSRMDFSYRKCLRGFVEWKYPAHAEKFARSNPYLVKVK